MEFKAIDRRQEGDTLLRKCQLVELYLLDVFVEICEANHLRYFLDGGTLLGAFRHNGIIPWDDDIDVGMPIEDYRKFLKLAPDLLPANIFLQTPHSSPGSFMPFAKLRDMNSFMCEEHTRVEQPCGIFLDIFPFVKFPKLPTKLSWMLSKGCAFTWRKERHHRTLLHRTITGIFMSGLAACFWRIANLSMWTILATLRLILPTVWHDHPNIGGEAMIEVPDEVLLPLSEHEFEGKIYKVPHDSIALLKQHYGDWQTPPPSEKRVWHHSILSVDQPPRAPWSMNQNKK